MKVSNNIIIFDKSEYSSKILMFWQVFNGIKVGYSRVINTSLLIALTLSNPFFKIKFSLPSYNPLPCTNFLSFWRMRAILSNDVMIHDFYIKNVSNFSILFFFFLLFSFLFYFNIDRTGKNRKLKCDP